jgi:hypothetical protein
MARFQKDVLLKGRLRIRAVQGPERVPIGGLDLTVRACGFV